MEMLNETEETALLLNFLLLEQSSAFIIKSLSFKFQHDWMHAWQLWNKYQTALSTNQNSDKRSEAENESAIRRARKIQVSVGSVIVLGLLKGLAGSSMTKSI